MRGDINIGDAINMNWETLETSVADCVRSEYTKLSTDGEKRAFCKELRRSHAQLKSTAHRNPAYESMRMGEAYALKYHLQRTDNIYVALSHINKTWQIPEKMDVLDIGSGTGSGPMALALWAKNNFPHRSVHIKTFCVESQKPMCDTAKYLLDAFLSQIQEKLFVFDFNVLNFSLEKCVEYGSTTRKRFDLILFSFTFDTQDPIQQQATMEQVAAVSSLLKPNGIVMFLTPTTPATKQQFMDQVASHLVTDHGMTDISVDIRKNKPAKWVKDAPSERPGVIVNLRREINRECRRLGIEDVFGEDPKWDDPYYGFVCKMQAFKR